MARTIVDSSELKRLMTEELQAMEDDYKNCQFGGIMKLQEPDEHGCNWSPPMIRCSGIRGEVCKADAAIVTQNFQAKYNIA